METYETLQRLGHLDNLSQIARLSQLAPLARSSPAHRNTNHQAIASRARWS